MLETARAAIAKRLCRALARILGIDMASYDAMVKTIELASPEERERLSKAHLDIIRRFID